MRLAGLLLLWVVGATCAAAAPDRPPLAPTRDATIEYQVQGRAGRPPIAVRVHFSGGRMRAETANLPGYVVVDRAADRALMVMQEQHAYFELPLQSGMARDFLPSDRMSFTRRGEERVAGLPCTVWDVRAPAGRSATACVTADGLVLRGEGHDPQYGDGSIEAVSLSYAPQPASLFKPPAGFQRIEIPVLPGLGGVLPPR